MQSPEQHCALWVKGCPGARHEAASTGVGTKIEATRGNASADATPIFRKTALRDKRISSKPARFRVSNNPDFSSRHIAIQITFSSTGDFDCFIVRMISATLFSPLQSFQTSAAVRFRQWARFVSSSYTRNSSLSCRTMASLRLGLESSSPFFMFRLLGIPTSQTLVSVFLDPVFPNLDQSESLDSQ